MIAKVCRKPDIMADAAYAILCRDQTCTGNFFIDDDVITQEGIHDLDQYAAVPGTPQDQMINLVNLGVSWENLARAFQKKVVKDKK